MSDLLEKTVTRYPYTAKLHSYRGAARIIAAGNGQEITVLKTINGVKVAIAVGIATCLPPLVLDVGVGASEDFEICVEGTNGDCLNLAVIDTNFTVTPPVQIGDVNIGDIEMGDVTVTNDCANPVGVEICGPEIVSCGSPDDVVTVNSEIQTLGDLPASLPATPPGFTFQNIIDAPTGSPFSDFPYEFQPAATGNGVGAFAPLASADVVDACAEVTLTSIEFILDHTQLTDSDPGAGDPSDMTIWIDLNGTPVASTVTMSAGTVSGSAFPEGSSTVRPLNQLVTLTATLDNPSQYTLEQASDMILVSTFQSQDLFSVAGASRTISYTRAESCLPMSLSTKDCNSDASIIVSRQILTALSTQSLVLPDVCAVVDGEPANIIPVARLDPISGVIGAPLYVDKMGVAITGVVALADPCDCDCLECGSTFQTPFSLQTTSNDSNRTGTEERGITFTPDEDTILQSVTLPLNQAPGTPLSTNIGLELRLGATPYGSASNSSQNVVDIPQNEELRQFTFDDVLLSAGQVYTFTVSDQNSGVQFQVSDNNIDNFPQVGNINGLIVSSTDAIVLIEGLRA